MTKLSINVNKIAWLRNARGENRPNLLETSKILVDCGVDGLTVHPRPDLRHITPDDVYDLSNLCKNSNIEFNIEGNPYSEKAKDYPGFIQLVKEIEPDQCTLVPDSPDQLTSDHGWQIDGKDHNVLINIIEELKTDKTRVSLFVDPDIKQIENIKSIGLDVNAGHDLDLVNLKPFLDRAPVDEVSIGHALISDALIDGLDNVTKKYLDLCK